MSNDRDDAKEQADTPSKAGQDPGQSDSPPNREPTPPAADDWGVAPTIQIPALPDDDKS